MRASFRVLNVGNKISIGHKRGTTHIAIIIELRTHEITTRLQHEVFTQHSTFNGSCPSRRWDLYRRESHS